MKQVSTAEFDRAEQPQQDILCALNEEQHEPIHQKTPKMPLTDQECSTADHDGVHTERNSFATEHNITQLPSTQAQTVLSSEPEDDGTAMSLQPVCVLCDEPATVRLLPCGHEIICMMCSRRAKKCLKCKVQC